MDGFYGADGEFEVDFIDIDNIRHVEFKNSEENELMTAAWLDLPLADAMIINKANIIFKNIIAEKAVGIDLFNGTEQELEICIENNNTVLREVFIKDYPSLIKICKA